MNEIKDLTILEKYLSEEELKEVAKEVAFSAMNSSLGDSNPYAKDNLDYYIKKGAFQAVLMHCDKIGIESLSQDLEKKITKIVKSTDRYDISSYLDPLVKESLQKHKDSIDNKVSQLVTDLVNDNEEWGSVYQQFSEFLGDVIGGMIYNVIENHFKGK